MLFFDKNSEFDLSSCGMCVLDDNLNVTEVNEQFLFMTGFSRDEVLGQSLTQFDMSDKVQFADLNFKEDQNHTVSLEYIHKRKNGSSFFVEVCFLFNKKLQQVVALVNDKSSVFKSQQKMELLKCVFENSKDAILITDNRGKIQVVNDSFTQITGYTEKDALGKTPRILKSGRHSLSFYKEFWNSLLIEGSWKGEIWNKRKNGEIYPEWLSVSSVDDAHGERLYYISQFSDITKRKRIEEEQHFRTYHDSLTLLPNRSLLFEKLNYLRDLYKTKPVHFAVLFCNIDRFKQINDSAGHSVGDELLKIVASRIDHTLRSNDFVARTSGDEFIVVITGEKSVDNITKVTNKLLCLFKEPVSTEVGEHKISISIGISKFPSDTQDVTELISFADLAMTKVKQGGGGHYSLFDEKEKAAIKQKITLENEMFSALRDNQFEVWYQPQINSVTDEVYGLECLVRWRHPTEGLITPNVFIPIAEANGFIKDLGYFVLKTACQQYRKWRLEGLFNGLLAVNVSLKQFERNDLLTQVEAVLQDEMIPGSSIELEVTESLFSEDNSHLRPELEHLRELGIQIAIDDFGTGYSSLQRLKELPVDNLKIDKCFVDNIVSSEQDASIVKVLMLLSQTFGLSIIAEGVETQEQAEALNQLGCNRQQGYLYSKPLDAVQMSAWLSDYQQKRKVN